MNDTAIVIITYNSGEEIGPCLQAAQGSGAEILVVDNASTDGTCEEVLRRGVRLLANSRNLGFAAAVNQGFRATSAEFVLLLNPDAHLVASIEPLKKQCGLPGTGAAGGKLLDGEGRTQRGFTVRRLPTVAALCFEVLLLNRLWPGNPLNWRFRCLDLNLEGNQPIRVEQPAGAFLMIRRDAWQQLGGFDERFYPIWFEDVDFCCRLCLAGLAVFYVPQAVAKHTGAHSIRRIRLEMRQIYWYGSLLEYVSKHFGRMQQKVVCCSILVGCFLRLVAGMLGKDRWSQLAAYRSVVRLTLNFLLTGSRASILGVNE